MANRLKELEAAYPKKGVVMQEMYFIDKSLLCSTAFAATAMGVSGRTITGWVKKGLEYSPYSLPKFKLIDLDYMREWYLENIDQKAAKGRGSVNVAPKPPTETEHSLEDEITSIEDKIKAANKMLQFKSTTIESAEKTEKILNALLKTVKLGKESGELIPKRDTDRVVSEIIAVLISGYKRDLKILPNECENRPSIEIHGILERAYKSNIEKLSKLSKLKPDKKLYYVLEVILERIADGETVDKIVGRLEV